MDNMDVDLDPRTYSPSSGTKRSSTPPSSTDKRPKLVLPQDQLNALNDSMKNYSRRKRWLYRIDDAGDDASEWRDLFSDVLLFLTDQLAATDLKGSVIPAQTPNKANEMVMGFDNDEFKEWKGGVQKGVKENDWADLISRCKYLFAVDGRIAFNFSESGTSSRDFAQLIRFVIVNGCVRGFFPYHKRSNCDRGVLESWIYW